MKDRTLPTWFRVLQVGIAVSQVAFGVTLLLNPSAIGSVWPWPLTSITTRILAASTLVSVPLEVVPVLVNRWSVARIPVVMLLTYRVFQILVGLVHLNRFDFSRPVTWNYFGLGTLMMLILAYVLVRGYRLAKPESRYPVWLAGDSRPRLRRSTRLGLRALSALFLGLGVIFLVFGPAAAPLWFEASGQLTPLTARLFSSPMIGLALGLWLILGARTWREVAVPALGMATFGFVATLALAIERTSVAPPAASGYVTAAIPSILLFLGLYLLGPARPGSPATKAGS